MKNAVLLLLVYSAVVTVFLIAYFLPIRQALGRLFGGMNFAQRFILAFAFFTIVAVVGVFMLLLWLEIDVATNLGQVGDFVGGILNPILSFLALIAIVSSISLQEKELSSTIDSLRSQEEIFKVQNFESSFFNLLAMQRSRRSEQKIYADGKLVGAYIAVSDIISDKRKEIDSGGYGKLRSFGEAKKVLQDMDGLDSSYLVLDQFSLMLDVIESAALDSSRFAYYCKLAYSDLDIHEALVLVNFSMFNRRVRQAIKKHATVVFRGEYYISPLLERYYKP